MDPIHHALNLLKRHAELESGLLRQPGGIRVTDERELYALREELQRYRQAVEAILQTASNLHRTVDTLHPRDVRRLEYRNFDPWGRFTVESSRHQWHPFMTAVI
jgi:hypothetical protein